MKEMAFVITTKIEDWGLRFVSKTYLRNMFS